MRDRLLKGRQLRQSRWLVVPLALVAGLLIVVNGEAELTCDSLAGVRRGICIVPEVDRVQAPDFQEDLVPVGDGDPPRLRDVRGEVVVINYWGSWCAPCRTEQPALNLWRSRSRNAE